MARIGPKYESMEDAERAARKLQRGDKSMRYLARGSNGSLQYWFVYALSRETMERMRQAALKPVPNPRAERLANIRRLK